MAYTMPYGITGSDLARDALKIDAQGNFVYTQAALNALLTGLDAKAPLVHTHDSPGSDGIACIVVESTTELPESAGDGLRAGLFASVYGSGAGQYYYDSDAASWPVLGIKDHQDSNFTNAGSYSHGAIDLHLSGGSNTHTAIDTHLDAGSDTHTTIDAHIANTSDGHGLAMSKIMDASGAKGDIVYYDSDGAPQLLGIGSTGQFLGLSDARPLWGDVAAIPPGYIDPPGLDASYESDAGVYLEPGVFEVGDSKYELTTQTAVNVSGVGAAAWYGIELLSGAGSIPSGGDFTFTALADFAFDDAKHGWYNSVLTNDRIVSLFMTDATSDIVEYYIRGGWFWFSKGQNFVDTGTAPTTQTLVAVGAPAIGVRLLVAVRGGTFRAGQDTVLYLGAGEDAGKVTDADAIWRYSVAVGIGLYSRSTPITMTDTSQRVNYAGNDPLSTLKLYLDGFRLPGGM